MNAYSLATLPNDGKTLILCANSRLAQSLTAMYNQARARDGEQRWATLDTRTVGAWLEALTEEIHLRGEAQGLLSRKTLSSFQERLLWEQAIREALPSQEQALFDAPAMANVAAQAHALVTEWALPVLTEFPSDESRQFKQWQSRFLALCTKHHCIDSISQQQALLAYLPHAPVPLPDRLLFAGFLSFTPMETALQKTLAARGVEIGLITFEQTTDRIRAESYPDADSECLAAALWARDHLARNPEARLGIVVPDMAANRERIQDTLDDILTPHCIRSSLYESERPFNISLGRALNHYPLVSTAMNLLNTVANPEVIEQRTLRQLLHSPFWSAASGEADSRAVLEARLRESVAPKAKLIRFIDFITQQLEKTKRTAPTLCAHLYAIQEAATEFKKQRLPSAWSSHFRTTLENVGWLSGTKLSSHAFQTQHAFLEVLRKLAGLDYLLGKIDVMTALKQLSLLCSERIFQPKTIGNPPLQVLGLLEASGLQFDALWVMGLVDNIWPPAARPNPLLSASAQRTAGCPNASAPVQLSFALKIHDQLCTSAPDITFSWPRVDGATALRPSPLLADWLPGRESGFPDSPHWVALACTSPGQAMAEPLEDAFAPAVLEGEKVSGGTWLIRAQAICPAWAYFQYRLGASKLKEPIEGLDAAKRGTLAHDALEQFWNKVANSDNLKSLIGAHRLKEVERAVDLALTKFDKDPKLEALKPRFRQLERQRLIKLLLNWLDLEDKRTQPFTVIDNERKVTVEIEGISASMKIDRIDQLEDGRLLIIDYKTGAKIDFKNWASERITEPQLPIYAAISKPTEGPVTAVAFAKVLIENAAYAGLSESEGVLDKLHVFDSTKGRKLFPQSAFPDWSSVLTHWDTSIRAIAYEIKTGNARICFEDEKALEYCEVKPLLRLAERNEQLAAAASALQIAGV